MAALSWFCVSRVVGCLLLECVQSSLDQGLCIGRVVNAQALVFVGDVDPVVQTDGEVLRRFRDGRMAIGPDLTEHTGGNQFLAKLVEHGLDFGLQPVDVEIFSPGVARLAGGYIGFEGVIGTFAQVAAARRCFQPS